jgi:type I restriction enzyme S subunit
MAGEWASKSLGEICEFRGGQGFPHKHQGAVVGEYPFIKVSDMELSGNRHRITRANHWIDEATRKELRAKPHPATSTVFAKIGVALTYNRRRLLSRPTIVDNNMMAAVPIESEVDPLFLYYLLKVTDFNEVVSGTALPFINGSDLAKMQVEIPPLTTQRAIASVLGTLDDLIELNRETNEILEEMARALFKSWFVDFDPVRAKLEGRPPAGMDAAIAALFPNHFQDSELGQIPKGWEVGTIKDCCKYIQNGGTPRRDQPRFWQNGDIPWLTSGEVRQSIVTTPTSFITAEGLAESSAKWVSPLSTVVALYGATAGQVSLVASRLTTNQAVCSLVPKENFAFFNYLWMREATGELENKAVGSAQQNISKGIVEETSVILPPSPLVEKFEQTVCPLFDTWILNLYESRDLATLRDTLLPKLLSGEVSVFAAVELIPAST